MRFQSKTSGEMSLTPFQVDKLLSIIPDFRHRTLIELALAGGMRREDIVGILAKDIDFKECQVVFFENKKNKTHAVCLPQRTMNDLKALININGGSKWLFPSSYGKKDHISGKTAWRILQRYCCYAGIEPRPFHALRATCVKLCQAHGWPPEATAKHLDDTIRTIQQHYSTPSVEEMKAVSKEKPIL